MLSAGIRTPVGIKLSGSSLAVIQDVALAMESAIQKVPGTQSGQGRVACVDPAV